MEPWTEEGEGQVMSAVYSPYHSGMIPEVRMCVEVEYSDGKWYRGTITQVSLLYTGRYALNVWFNDGEFNDFFNRTDGGEPISYPSDDVRLLEDGSGNVYVGMCG